MITTSEHFRRPLGAVPLPCGDILIEFGLMADHEDTSLVFHEGAFQLFFGVYVQVVGGLVEDQKVRGAAHQLAKADFGLFAAGEDFDLALDVLGGEAAFGQGGADFVLGKARKLLPDLFDAGGVNVLIHFLFEIADLQILAGLDRSLKGGDETQEALKERRLSDAV